MTKEKLKEKDVKKDDMKFINDTVLVDYVKIKQNTNNVVVVKDNTYIDNVIFWF